MNRRLRAFTLLELLIGMIISSIVISICYMSYGLIRKEYEAYKVVKKELVETLEFNSVLESDIVNSKKVFFDENKLTLIKKNDLNLEYNFGESFILRKDSEVVDTFRLIALNISPAYFKGQEDPEALLISLSFDALVVGDQEHFQFSKMYDAETVVNGEMKNVK